MLFRSVVIRTRAGSVSVQGRAATGVRVMNLADGSKVASVARMLLTDDGDTINGDAAVVVADSGDAGDAADGEDGDEDDLETENFVADQAEESRGEPGEDEI